MKKTTKLLSALLLILTVLFVTQTTTATTASAAEKYKKYDSATFYESSISKKDVQKALKYTEAVPKDIITVFKAAYKIYFVKDIKTIKITYLQDYVIRDVKTNVIGIVKSTESINTVYISATATAKDIKTALLSAVGYFFDTKFLNHPSDGPIFCVWFKEEAKVDPYCYQTSILFAKYFSDYCNKVTLDKKIYNYVDALIHPISTVTTTINSDVATKCNSNHISADRWSSISYKQLNSFTLYDDTIESKTVKEVKSWFIYLPSKLMEHFYQEGWTLVLSDETVLSDNEPCGGLCNYNDKIICIKADIEGMAPILLYHELGHYVDYSFSKGNLLSSNADFQQLYYKYKDSYKEDGLRAGQSYAASSPVEFFAVTFEEYYLQSNNLKVQAPEVYTYMDNLNKTVLQ